MMDYYRRKPTTVAAIQWTGDNLDAIRVVGAEASVFYEDGSLPILRLVVAKSSSICDLRPGDWVLREPDGVGFSPCTAAIFEASYEPTEVAVP